jgi:hypothetical protein
VTFDFETSPIVKLATALLVIDVFLMTSRFFEIVTMKSALTVSGCCNGNSYQRFAFAAIARGRVASTRSGVLVMLFTFFYGLRSIQLVADRLGADPPLLLGALDDRAHGERIPASGRQCRTIAGGHICGRPDDCDRAFLLGTNISVWRFPMAL